MLSYACRMSRFAHGTTMFAHRTLGFAHFAPKFVHHSLRFAHHAFLLTGETTMRQAAIIKIPIWRPTTDKKKWVISHALSLCVL